MTDYRMTFSDGMTHLFYFISNIVGHDVSVIRDACVIYELTAQPHQRGPEGVSHSPISIVRPETYPRLSSSARVAVRKSGKILCTSLPRERGHAGRTGAVK